MASYTQMQQPNVKQSGGDPRGRTQNQIQYQQQRFENQQGPLVNEMARNYGRGSEANYGDYTDIMNRYRQIAGGGGAEGGGGGGATGYGPSLIGYNDPFNSYKGFTEFSQTGGYSPQDIANMRARGVSPIRSTYAAAQRGIGQQRSLQGGYAPNAIATMAKMAREQGQSAADAVQGVEAGLAEARNKGRLSGLSGMSDIEKQRLAADLEVAKFNAQAQMSAAASGSAASAANRADQLRALAGMTSLYGTTPGMAELFGNQALQGTQMGGNFGLGLLDRERLGQQVLPGQFDTVMDRTGQILNAGTGVAMPIIDFFRNRNRQQVNQQPNYRQNPGPQISGDVGGYEEY